MLTHLGYDVTRTYTSLTPTTRDPDIVPPKLGTVWTDTYLKSYRFVLNNHSAALAIGDVVALDKTAAYPNAVTESGTDSAGVMTAVALTSVAFSDGTGFVLATKSTHGLVDGQKITVSGTAGGTYDGVWLVDYIGADTFGLRGSSYSADKSGTVTPEPSAIMAGVACGDIPAAGYGWIQFSGVGTACVDGNSADVAVGDSLKMVDSSLKVVQDGAYSAAASLNNHLRALKAETVDPVLSSIALTDSTGKVLATSSSHGFVDGDVVRVTGTSGVYDGYWTVADDETDTFTLKGAVWTANATATEIRKTVSDNVYINCKLR